MLSFLSCGLLAAFQALLDASNVFQNIGKRKIGLDFFVVLLCYHFGFLWVFLYYLGLFLICSTSL